MNDPKTNTFKEALSIKQGKIAFIMMISGMVGCFVSAWLLENSYAGTMISMVLGVVSIAGGQQFMRILASLNAIEDQLDKEEDSKIE